MNKRKTRNRSFPLAWAVFVGIFAGIPACDFKSGKNTKPQEDSPHLHAEKDDHASHDHEHEDHAEEVTLAPDAIERYGIKVEQASLYKLQPTFLAPARVSFNAEAIAHVGSPLPGRVIELKAKLGDVVKKDDILLVVESPELGQAQSEYLQKRIIAQTSLAAVEPAKNALDRATRLYEQNKGIAFDDLQKREVEFKSAQATQHTSQSAAVAAENRLLLLGMGRSAVDTLIQTGEVNPRFSIVAPLPGRVVEREVTLGELVSPEKETLIVVADTTTLWILADVPEARLPQVAIGAAAWLKTGADGHKHEGVVSYISPVVDPRTRSAEVRIAVQCEHGALWPGMFVQVEITTVNRENPDPAPVIAVPEAALQTVEGSPSLFVPVANEPNAFSRRTVVVGKPVGGMVPVHSGLVEGESFVAAGSFILKAELGKASAEHQH